MIRVAIVGSGPSAIYALAGLITSPMPLRITVFERNETAGVGTPYDPKTNSPEMLANIASIEIPEIDRSLLAFLEGCSGDKLRSLGVDPGRLGEREFYPRIALGAYFSDRLAHLVAQAPAQGHAVEILARHEVVDVVAGSTVDIAFIDPTDRLQTRPFDRVVMATGHSIDEGGSEGFPSAYSPDHGDGRSFGILGSSLSAIDLAVAIASDRGAFTEGGYVLADGVEPFSITLLSRGGRLPEADFFCPLPAEPCPDFTEEQVKSAVARAAPGSKLDVVFALFASALASADPDYAAHIRLAELTADSFAEAYFADRDAADPFAWAKANLEEAQRNHADRHTVPWRYTLLRCHEAFGSCVADFSADEIARFNKGMKRVFADNYAAVPHLSIERLLALHEAGVLAIAKLSSDYRMSVRGQSCRIDTAGSIMQFDRMYDARGQAASTDEDLPFPSLRFLLAANRMAEGREPNSVQVEEDYRVSSGINATSNIWCLSIPFLLKDKPFVQGLTSCWDMGRAAAQGIIDSLREQAAAPSLRDLRQQVLETEPIFLEQSVVLIPNAETGESSAAA